MNQRPERHDQQEHCDRGILAATPTGDGADQEARRDDADVEDGLVFEAETVGKLDDDIDGDHHHQVRRGQP